MGRTWWYPPPAGADYDAVAARDHHDPGQARRAFRRVHPSRPGCGRTRAPRCCSRSGAERSAPDGRGGRRPQPARGGPVRCSAATAFRSRSAWRCGSATTGSSSLHSAGLPVLVTRYDDLVHDPAPGRQHARAFLAGLGMALDADPDRRRHRARTSSTPSCVTARTPAPSSWRRAPTSLAVYDALEAVVGASRVVRRSGAPPRARPRSQPSSTRSGPHTELAWHPPPWAPGHAGEPAAETEGPDHDR